MIKLLVTGGRNFNEPESVRVAFEEFSRLHSKPAVLIVGDCPTGLDYHARKYARENGIAVVEFMANWSKYKASAGPRRNAEMVNAKPDYAIIFPGGRGTSDCARRVAQKQIPFYNAADDGTLQRSGK